MKATPVPPHDPTFKRPYEGGVIGKLPNGMTVTVKETIRPRARTDMTCLETIPELPAKIDYQKKKD